MKRWLYPVACFAMLGLIVSCGPKSKPDTNKLLSDGGDTVKYKEIPGKYFLGDTSVLVADLDTLSLAAFDNVTRYEFDIDKDGTMSFCGAVNDPKERKSYKIMIWFNKAGLSSTRKMAMGRIRGGDKFMYTFTAPAKGTVQIAIEEERAVGWKHMGLKQEFGGPECCPPQQGTLRLFSGRTGVTTTNHTGSGATVKVEQ